MSLDNESPGGWRDPRGVADTLGGACVLSVADVPVFFKLTDDTDPDVLTKIVEACEATAEDAGAAWVTVTDGRGLSSSGLMCAASELPGVLRRMIIGMAQSHEALADDWRDAKQQLDAAGVEA